MGVLWLGKKAFWLIVLFERCLEACLCHRSYNKYPLPLRDTTQIFRLGPHWFVKTLGWESPSLVRGPSLTSQESLPPPPAASPLNTSHDCCRVKPSRQVFWERDNLANTRTHKETFLLGLLDPLSLSKNRCILNAKESQNLLADTVLPN